MKRDSKPIYSLNDEKAPKIPQRNTASEKAEKKGPSLPEKITLKEMSKHRPEIMLNFSSVHMPYKDIWRDYKILVTASRLQRVAGFDAANYRNARQGRRGIKAAHLFAACLLSRVTVQQAYDAFHLCENVRELTDYGNEAVALTYLLEHMKSGWPEHGYDELIWYTIKLNQRDKIVTLPEIHKNHTKWKEMQRKIDIDRITIEYVKRNQKLD